MIEDTVHPADRLEAVQAESSTRLCVAARLAGFIEGMGLRGAFLASLDRIPSEPAVERELRALFGGGAHV